MLRQTAIFAPSVTNMYAETARDTTAIRTDDGAARTPRAEVLLFVIVCCGIGAVAYADSHVETISLAYLYILPLALSAMTFRLPVTLPLVFLCVALHDLFSPVPGDITLRLALNAMALTGFTAVVLDVEKLSGQRRHLAAVIRRQRDELQRDINLAAEVQRRLLPVIPPHVPGIGLASRMTPAHTVGGDYFDFIRVSDDDLDIVIADVTGKGAAAALLMSSTVTALRLGAPRAQGIDRLLGAVSQILYDATDTARFVTLCYARLHVGDRRLEYANAGQPPPLVVRAEAEACEWLEACGFPLGLFPEARYETATTYLRAGDIVVFYTDGLTEAENVNGKQFTRERLALLVARHKGQSARELMNLIYKTAGGFRGSERFDDDLTLIVLKVEGADGELESDATHV
jgi:serine phosphatase RsbU (regulator of sigma subunit)